jgi:hypothetical protein
VRSIRQRSWPAGFQAPGRGAWISPLEALDFAPVRVSNVAKLSEASILRSFAESHIDVDAGRRLERNAGIVAPNGFLHDAIIGALASRSERGGRRPRPERLYRRARSFTCIDSR